MKRLERADNLGTMTRQRVCPLATPNADETTQSVNQQGDEHRVDLLFVNPPAPDGAIWIRGQHRVGRRSREGMIWAQVSLAQLAALFPDKRVEIVDAIAQHMTWPAFEALLDARQPRFYVTQLTGPTLQNDMYGVFLAKARGALTVAFGTHVTPMPVSTMEAFPALDYALRGEPELTLRELVDTLGNAEPGEASVGGPWSGLDPAFQERLSRLYRESLPGWSPAWASSATARERIASITGLVWRDGASIIMNKERPLIAKLDDLPLPRHDLLPLENYRAPLVGGPYSFVVTSRGCPGGCSFCIKHVSYGRSVRWRSPSNVLDEIQSLVALGVHSIHMYADLFTVNREQVMGICQGLIDRQLGVRWTCNSRVDYVDDELLEAMARSGCWMISWGIESGNDAMLQRMHKGITTAQAEAAVQAAHCVGIRNWGYFVVGLPGETEETIRDTIAFARRLPLDLALFHIAAPYPGTPFFFEIFQNGWFRQGTRWEQVDMDRSTVVDYPQMSAEQIEHWARKAFRAWALRPGPMWTYARTLVSRPSLWRAAVDIGIESLGWARVR